MRDMDDAERAAVVRFATGSSRVPLARCGGWNRISDSSYSSLDIFLRMFSDELHKAYTRIPSVKYRLDGFDPVFTLTMGGDQDQSALPHAHTCFNQLVLPAYPAKAVLMAKLRYALANTAGFHLT